MAASTYDITIEQGADFSLGLTIKNGSGVAIDITGYTFAAQLREKVHSTTVLATFTCTITNAAAGQMTMSLTNAQTSAINVSKYDSPEKRATKCAYDLEMTRTDTSKVRLIEGVASVTPEVTR